MTTDLNNYHKDATAMRDKLNAVSKSFCLAKWLQVSIHLPTGRTHSCYHPRQHKVPLNELATNPSALHNTQFKKEQRKKMLEGTRPEECSYCWNVEDLSENHLSDRHYRSSEDWSASRLEEVQNLPWDSDIIPSYVEVNFNQACQFKCIYCSPPISSTWMKEVKTNGAFPTIHGYNRLDHYEENGLIPYAPTEQNPYVDAFWKWWPSLYPELKWFRMTGGEPLLDENTFRVFDYIEKNPNPKLNLSITSNMCPPPERFSKFITKVKSLTTEKKIANFYLYASIDSIGAQAEYLRNGLNYKYFLENVLKYLNEVPNGKLCFINTFNILSIPGFTKFIDMVLTLRKQYNTQELQRVNFDTPMLQVPYFLNLQTLPDACNELMENNLEYLSSQKISATNPFGITEAEIAKFQRTTSWMKNKMNERGALIQHVDFYLFTKEYDRRNNLNFLSVYPELKEFYDLCKEEAEIYIKCHPIYPETANLGKSSP